MAINQPYRPCFVYNSFWGNQKLPKKEEIRNLKFFTKADRLNISPFIALPKGQYHKRKNFRKLKSFRIKIYQGACEEVPDIFKQYQKALDRFRVLFHHNTFQKVYIFS